MSKIDDYPLDESKLPFEIPKDAAAPRENCQKLGQMITDRIPAKKRHSDGRTTPNTGAWRAS